MSGLSATPNSYPYPNEPVWSRSERAIARKVFDAALNRELHQIVRETKQRANRIKEPADVWELEHYLTRRRKDIDSRYEFRSSRLTRTLGMLLCEQRISEEELKPFSEDKRLAIRSCSKALSEAA